MMRRAPARQHMRHSCLVTYLAAQGMHGYICDLSKDEGLVTWSSCGRALMLFWKGYATHLSRVQTYLWDKRKSSDTVSQPREFRRAEV